MHQASLSSGSLIRVSQQHSISSENFDQDMISSLETWLNTLKYILRAHPWCSIGSRVWIHWRSRNSNSSDTQPMHCKVKPLTFEIYDQIWTSQVKFHEYMLNWWIWSRKIKINEVTCKKGNLENIENFTKYPNFMFKCTTFSSHNFQSEQPFSLLQSSNESSCSILQLCPRGLIP